MGAAGASAGLVAGGTIGAIVGFIPAIFTFGLSIPVGAAVGGGAGSCAGAVGGGTAGALGGSAAGYGLYQNRESISNAAKRVAKKVSDCTKYTKDKVIAPMKKQADRVAQSVSSKVLHLK